MHEKIPAVVIVGGGFGGLAAARRLKGAPANVILIDRTNHHLFQPLLYQVATSVLAPGQIASPIRGILRSSTGLLVIFPMGRIERCRITFMGRTTDAIVAMLLNLRVQVNGNHNRVHASLKSSRGPRGISFAGSP